MNDAYARQVIKAGKDLGISDRGIIIGLATVFVESNWVMYANQADPESLNFPHEALSYDANSVGLFQQRAEWWGTCAQRMDPYESARMFYTRLMRFDYTSTSHSPGYYAQQVQGSAYPDRYDTRISDAQQLYDRLTTTAKVKAMEKILSYSRTAVGDYDGVAQTKPWDCGPASAQIILQAAGINRTEDWIIAQANASLAPADKISTNGTNHAGLLCPLLNQLLPGSGYTEVWVPQSNSQAADTLWSNCVASINAGRGVLLNFEVPPWQGVRTSRGSTPPPYPTGSTTFHYVAGMGVAQDADGSRHVWIADPAAFGGITGYWVPVVFLSLLIVPHAYAWASTAKPATVPAPAPTPAPAPAPAPAPVPAATSRTELEWLAYLGHQPSLAQVLTLARDGDTRARLVLARIEAVNPAALQQFIIGKAA